MENHGTRTMEILVFIPSHLLTDKYLRYQLLKFKLILR